jgi:putative ABC transport system permease protein
MSEKALAAAYDLEGAFSSVSLRLMRDAAESEVIERADHLLAWYGGRGAHGRKDQMSHAFLDAELKQLKAMASVLPPIFLLVSAFLVNMTLSRLVVLEREQIGLLKAVGYGTREVALHYIKFVALIALAGTAIGSAVGTWLGIELTQLYGDFFHFPFLIFRSNPELYLLGASVTVAAAVIGAFWAVWKVARLPPAVAMQPPAPPRYRRLLVERFGLTRLLSQAGTMVFRNLVRFPARALSTILGISLATAILAAALSLYDSVEVMIDVQFLQTERQDASIDFTARRPLSALQDVSRLPGVIAVEPYRTLPARLRHGTAERRVGIIGKPPQPDLSRVLDERNQPLLLPESGLALSSTLADILGVRLGDEVEVELLEDDPRTILVPVTAVVQGYLGLMAYMDLAAANRLAGEGPVISGVHLSFDAGARDALFAKLKLTPIASFIALQRISLQKFRETLAQNLFFMLGIYVTLAVTIAFGVVYNSARISLSERARELASLRVLGFTRAEASLILLSELAILTLAAQPLGWVLGYALAFGMSEGLASELYRMPLVLNPATNAIASLVTVAAAVLSAFVVRRRIDRFDLVEVLKTRD